MSTSRTTLTHFLNTQPKRMSLDTETTGLTWKDKAFMYSYAWHDDYGLCSGYIDLRTDLDLGKELMDYVTQTQPITVFHNAKFDFHKLGFYPAPHLFDDTCLMIYLLNEHHVKGLKPAAEKILGVTTDEDEVLKLERRRLKLNKGQGYEPIPVDVLAPYALKDAEFTLQLYEALSGALKKIPSLEEVYSLEKQLILDVCVIESNGLGVDQDYVVNEIRRKGDDTIRIEKRIQELVNKPVGKDKNQFNPHSPKQLLDIFASMGYTLTGTGITELSKVDHELAKLIVEMRSAGKLKASYLEPMIHEAVYADGFSTLHPNFNLNRTVTKRFSSSGATES